MVNKHQGRCSYIYCRQNIWNI